MILPPANEPKSGRTARSGTSLGRILGHSLFPFVALALIASTVLFGPWVVLVLAIVWWNVVTRVA